MMPGTEMKQQKAPVIHRMSDDREPEEIRQLNCLVKDSEPIRSAYYGIMDYLPVPLLVRYTPEKEGIYFQEPVHYQDYGITEEDLAEAIRQDALFAEHHGISRITPDISRKLQILYYF